MAGCVVTAQYGQTVSAVVCRYGAEAAVAIFQSIQGQQLKVH